MRVFPRASSIVPRFSSSRSTWFTVGRAAPESSASASCVSVITGTPSRAGIELGQLDEPAQDATLDGDVERLEQPLVEHPHLADEEPGQHVAYAEVLRRMRSNSGW